MATNPVSLDPTYLNPATQDQSTIPSFIRQDVDTSKVQQTYAPTSGQGAPSVVGTQTVAESTPGKISVFDPSKYTVDVRNHEMEHQDQATRSDGSIPLPGNNSIAPFGRHPTAAPESYEVGDPRNYSYGDEQGLLDAQASGKGISDFNIEQQADMVSHYQAKQNAYLAKAKAGTMTPADQHAMSQTYKAYHPMIQQLANQPKSFRDYLPAARTVLGIGKPVPLAPAPAAPGPPPFDVAGYGVAPADPLMAGRSVALPTKGHR